MANNNSSWKTKGLLSLMRFIKILALFGIGVLLFAGGSVLSTQFRNLTYELGSSPCFVEGATTIYCVRIEEEKYYIWRIKAIRGLDVIYIEYQTPKFRFYRID